MSHFLSFAIPGVPYGCNYALMAVGLVLTYRATGVFNLAYGAQAFLAAFLFDVCIRFGGIPVFWSFVLSVVVASPLLGLALHHFLFRLIPTASVTAKVVSTVGILITVPQLITIISSGSQTFDTQLNPPPQLWLDSNVRHSYLHIFGTPIDGAQLSVMIVTLGAVVVLGAVLRFTPLGLTMRAVVESRRLSELHRVDAEKVAAFSWALSSFLAGLSGVLFLGIQNSLDPQEPLAFTNLVVFGIAAALMASLRSLPFAAFYAIVLGVLADVLPGYLHQSGTLGTLESNLRVALPFLVLVIVLLANPALRGVERSSDPLANCDPPLARPAVQIRDRRLDRPMTWGFRLLVIVFLVSTSTWVPDPVWTNVLTYGLALSVVLLSITLVTGMSGQLSLCQAALAGIGAFTAAKLANPPDNMSVLVAAVIGAGVAAVLGLGLAWVSTRLSGLLLTLFTLTFAIFCDTAIFVLPSFGGGQGGVSVPRPQVGPFDFSSNRSFLLLVFLALVIVVAVVKLVQIGTVGRYLTALRGSPVAAESLGINLTRAKVAVFCMSAGIAGFGGALMASVYQNAESTSYGYAWSLAFAVMVITTSSRSIEGAIQAGMGYAITNQLLVQYLPRFQGVVIILFAVGAFTYAKHPEGILEYQKTKWLNRVASVLQRADERRGRSTLSAAGSPGVPASTAPGTPSPSVSEAV